MDGDRASLHWRPRPWPCLPAAWSPQAPPVGTGSRGTSVSAGQRSSAAEGDLWYTSVWPVGSSPVSLHTPAPCLPKEHPWEALACVPRNRRLCADFQELGNQATLKPPS